MSQPPEGSTFTVTSCPGFGQPVVIQYDGTDYGGDIPASSTLQFGCSKPQPQPPSGQTRWHFSQFAELAWTWENTPSWQNFSKLMLTYLYVGQHSLGAVPPAKQPPTGHTWQKSQLGGLFASANFKASTVNMNYVNFEPECNVGQTLQPAAVTAAFLSSVVYVLSENVASANHSIQKVFLANTTPSLNTQEIQQVLNSLFFQGFKSFSPNPDRLPMSSGHLRLWSRPSSPAVRARISGRLDRRAGGHPGRRAREGPALRAAREHHPSPHGGGRRGGAEHGRDGPRGASAPPAAADPRRPQQRGPSGPGRPPPRARAAVPGRRAPLPSRGRRALQVDPAVEIVHGHFLRDPPGLEVLGLGRARSRARARR